MSTRQRTRKKHVCIRTDALLLRYRCFGCDLTSSAAERGREAEAETGIGAGTGAEIETDTEGEG